MQFSSTAPIYLQITEGIMDSILEGEYPPGGRLPSVRDYAVKVQVNANTVMRAYEWLQQQQVIHNKRGIGYFVMPEARNRILQMRRNIFFAREADYFFGRMALLGITPDEVGDMYRKFLAAPKT